MRREDKLARSLCNAGIEAKVTGYGTYAEDGEITLSSKADGKDMHVQVGVDYVYLAISDPGGALTLREAATYTKLVKMIDEARYTAKTPKVEEKEA